ncbi:MAG TPA: CAP domain-containing protein [Pyrinomonadaceae bacterium]|nr:CAP domain-containing protein [Pyrinomonadaceae bacterium]
MPKHIAALLLILIGIVSAAFTQNNSASKTAGVGAVTFERARTIFAPSPAAVSSAEREAFDLINQKRADAGLEPLRWSDELATIARKHSEDMAEFKFFSHRGTDGSMVDNRADKLGISNWSAIGENIAFNRGYTDAASFAVTSWMNSPAHRENLLNKRWKESAIGVAILPDGTYYFTQVFLLRD